ncbi:MAG: outer membrane beta-barrel protein [Gammaproteobacteria bacterium]|nr:outer membrane beta-barrel protein [Gammaproteobacteria bacterium]
MAADTGWYAGVGVGGSKAKDVGSAAEVDASLLADYGITATSTAEDTDTAWKLFAGYRINKNFAVEGSYADLGKATFDSTVTAPAAGTVNISWKSKAWSLAAVGILPVTDQFEVFGKIGGHFWDVDMSVTATGGGGTAAGSASDDGTSWLYGVGASYSFSKNIAVRAEWERYQDVGDENTTGKSDVDMLSVGVQYKF